MLQHKKYFTVQNIADHFKIHSNVARLHLTKLAEIEAISSEYLKTGKGGRPGRVYKVRQDGITITFPRRDSSLLLKWSLDLIADLGELAIEKAKDLCYEDGKAYIQDLLSERKHRLPLPFEEKVKLLTNSSKLIGYIPEVKEQDGIKTFVFSIYNCPFHDQMTRHGEIVCSLHEAYLRGQVEGLFDMKAFSQFESMLHTCNYCNYQIDVHK